MTSHTSFLRLAAAAAIVATSFQAHAALVNLGAGSFTPAASVITFSEPGYAVGTVDPVYTIGTQTVSFGSHFQGQTITGGGVRTLSGTPTGPALTLVQDGLTFITTDGANPTSPVLTGTPRFNGPISIYFAQAVAAVGLSGGFFDAANGTTIEAFGIDGTSLGSITNSQTGVEFYGLFDNSGSNIAGISFYITGNEPAGFAIDNVTFGDANVVIRVPEPTSLALVGLAVLGLVASRRRQA